MRRVLRTTAAAICYFASSALAGEGDPPADVIAQATAEGEIVAFACGDNGFVIVNFLLDSVLVSSVESGTPCDPDDFDDDDDDEEEVDEEEEEEEVDEEEEEVDEEEEEEEQDAADGQAAADQVTAASQLFFPGLNANADLTSFFGLPFGRTTGGVIRPAPGGRDEAALRRCLEAVARLEAELAAAESAVAEAERDVADLAAGDDAALDRFRLDAATQLGEREDRFEFSDLAASDLFAAKRDLAAANVDPALADRIRNDGDNFNATLDAMREQLFSNQIFVESLSGQEAEVAAEILGALDAPPVGDVRDSAGQAAKRTVIQAIAKGVDRGRIIAAALASFLLKQNNDEIRQSLVGDLRDTLDELNNAAALVRRVEALRAEILERRDRRVATLLAERTAERDALAFEVFNLKTRIANEKAACDRFAGGSQNRPALRPVEAEPGASFEAAREGRRSGSFALALDLASLSQEIAVDARLNVFASVGVTFHDDGRRLIGMEGETLSLSGGASYRVSEGLTLGLFGRYGRTDLSGPGGEIEADTVSIGGFAEAELGRGLTLTGVAAYTWSEIDGTFVQGAVTTTGETEIEGVALQAALSKSFLVAGWTVTPTVSGSYADVRQDGFALSDATFAPGATTTQFSLTAGPTLSRSFVAGSGLTVTPSFGATGILSLSKQERLLRADGSTVRGGAFGVALSAGLGVTTPGGGSLGLDAGLSAFEGGQMGYTIGARGSIPFN